MDYVFEQQERIDLHIQEDGFYHILIKNCEHADFVIHIDNRRSASLFITYDGENNDITSKLHVAQGAQANILFWNEVSGCTLKQEVYIHQDAQIHIGLGDVSDGNSSYHVDMNLLERGAQVQMTSATLAGNKRYELAMHHLAPFTSGDMNNFAIVEDRGIYHMRASGIIAKGSHDSASHQATRVLTMSENQKSEVTPILLIDENEVKASHATTLGQPDEEQLYYLQSRGLTRNQALGLLTLGYLMPITEVLQNEEIRNQLQEKIEEKVIRNA